MPRLILRHTRRAETGSKPHCLRAPAANFHILTATESHVQVVGVPRPPRRSFAFVPGGRRWRAKAIPARISPPRDTLPRVTRAKSAPHLATSRSDNPSYVRLLFALVTKW